MVTKEGSEYWKVKTTEEEVVSCLVLNIVDEHSFGFLSFSSFFTMRDIQFNSIQETILVASLPKRQLKDRANN